jgi:chemotaxis protein CheD
MTAEPVTVRMADMQVVSGEGSLRTILGSCVGIILWDSSRRVAGLAHVLLPRLQGGDPAVGKYADSAIPALLARVGGSGGRPAGLQAYLVGGAQMFPGSSGAIASIGDQNVAAARAELAARGIRIVFEDTGGTAGRSVSFESTTGRIAVRVLPPVQRKEVPS